MLLAPIFFRCSVTLGDVKNEAYVGSCNRDPEEPVKADTKCRRDHAQSRDQDNRMWKCSCDLLSEEGSVVIEFCLILPILVLLFVGVVDLGLGVQQAIIVTEAAHAGTAYSSLPGKSSDVQGMQNAALAAAGGTSSLSAVATNWCGCNANGTPVSCSSTCSGASPMVYAQVTTTATVPVLLGYPGLPASFSLNGFSAVRVR